MAMRPRALKVEVHQNLGLQSQVDQIAELGLPDQICLVSLVGKTWQIVSISQRHAAVKLKGRGKVSTGNFQTGTCLEGAAHQEKRCLPAAQVVEVDGRPQGSKLGKASREPVCAGAHLSGVQLTSQQEGGAVRPCTTRREQDWRGVCPGRGHTMAVAVEQDADSCCAVGA